MTTICNYPACDCEHLGLCTLTRYDTTMPFCSRCTMRCDEDYGEKEELPYCRECLDHWDDDLKAEQRHFNDCECPECLALWRDTA